jgi:hypothetical protein
MTARIESNQIGHLHGPAILLAYEADGPNYFIQAVKFPNFVKRSLGVRIVLMS